MKVRVINSGRARMGMREQRVDPRIGSRKKVDR